MCGRKGRISLATTLCHSLAHLTPFCSVEASPSKSLVLLSSLSFSLLSPFSFASLWSLAFIFFLFLRQLLRRSLAGVVLNSSLLRIAVYLRVLTGKSSAMHNTANDPPRVFRESPLETFEMQSCARVHIVRTSQVDNLSMTMRNHFFSFF